MNGFRRRRGRCYCKEPIVYEAFDTLLPGDVVRWGKRGRLRKVRAVTYCRHDRLYMITFIKVVRSIYCGPTTVYTRQETRYMFKGVAGRASLCTSELECTVQADINEGRYGIDATVFQDKTVGIIY